MTCEYPETPRESSPGTPQQDKDQEQHITVYREYVYPNPHPKHTSSNTHSKGRSYTIRSIVGASMDLINMEWAFDTRNVSEVVAEVNADIQPTLLRQRLRAAVLSGCRSIGLPFYRSIGLSVYRSIGLSVYRSIGLSVPTSTFGMDSDTADNILIALLDQLPHCSSASVELRHNSTCIRSTAIPTPTPTS